MRARGSVSDSCTAFSLITTTAAAPSVIPDEFPAVTVPSFANTDGSLRRSSIVVLTRTCSSVANDTPLLFPSPFGRGLGCRVVAALASPPTPPPPHGEGELGAPLFSSHGKTSPTNLPVAIPPRAPFRGLHDYSFLF